MAGAWVLTGRDEELRVIRAAMAGAGVILAGAAGVGKTRLAREVLATASRRRGVRWAVATLSARSVPLGAFAEWMPAGGPGSAHLVRDVIDALSGGHPRVVVGVDDAHLLDESSAFVLHQLVLRHLATVVVTIRSGEAAPDAVTALWKDGHLQRIDLQPLSRQDCDRLVESVLDGPLDPVAAEKIWRLTRGNVLYLRHFVEQERAAGRLSPGFGTGPVETAVASSLADLIDAEMGSLSPEVGEVVDLLAVAEPLDASTLARLAEPAAVEEAESRALVSVEHTQAQARLRLAHPLYGEVRRARAGSMRLRRLRGRVAAASSGPETCDAREIVRLAVLLLESDLEPDPAIYIRAATEAIRLSDYALAERLAHAATAGGGFFAQLLRAGALGLLLRGEDAENVLSRIPPGGLTVDQRAEVVAFRIANLLFVQENPAQAEAILEAEDARGESGLAGTLACGRAVIHAAQARPRAAVEAAASALDSHQLTEQVEMFALCGLLIGLGDLGRIEEARPFIARGHDLTARLWEASGLRFLFTDIHEGLLRLAGYVEESVTVATRVREETIDVPGLPQVFTTAHLGEALLGVGRLPAAQQHLRQALSGARAGSGWEFRYRHDLAQVLAMLGKHDEAANTLRACMARTPPRVWLEPQYDLAESWVCAAGGTVSEAVGIARRAAERAGGRGQVAQEVMCLQTATQFGDRTTAARLTELASLVEGPRAPAAAAYAAALAAGAAPDLKTVSAQFEQIGDRVAAADAAAHAAIAYTRANRRGSASICVERARRLAAECGGADTPALREAVTPSPLTPRQREIIALAAQGLSNRQIAERLGMSLRTVEGHLYRASRETGATSRIELGQMLRGD